MRVPCDAQKEWSFDDWAYRFPVPMVEEMPEITGHTRFHRQFVTLARKHAQVIADDERIHELFRKHCFHRQGGVRLWPAVAGALACGLDAAVRLLCEASC